LTESENNETSSYNTKRLLCKKNLSTTAIGEMVMSINQLNRREHNLQQDEQTAKHKMLQI